MSGYDNAPRSSRRVTGAVLGGLAAGAAFGPAISIAPALADGDCAADTVVFDIDARLTDGHSVQEQFRKAFTPGALSDVGKEKPMILIERPHLG